MRLLERVVQATAKLTDLIHIARPTGDNPVATTGTSYKMTLATLKSLLFENTTWTVLTSIANDNALIEPQGDMTIDSIAGTSTFKYMKQGELLHVAFSFALTVTKSSETGSEFFKIYLPAGLILNLNPLACSHINGVIIDTFASPDTYSVFVTTGSTPNVLPLAFHRSNGIGVGTGLVVIYGSGTIPITA